MVATEECLYRGTELAGVVGVEQPRYSRRTNVGDLGFAAHDREVSSKRSTIGHMDEEAEFKAPRPAEDSIIDTRYWHALEDGRIQCDVCPRACKLHDGQRGLCFVRGAEAHRIKLFSYG